MADNATSSPADPNAECIRAAALFESGQHHEAAEIFRALSQRTDIPDGIRVVMAYNLATVFDKMGHPDHAVATHEYAVSLAQKTYVFAQESRANYLLKINRPADAIAVFEEILATSLLPPDVAERVKHNLGIARKG